MRILFLGNSFTFFNDLPGLTARLLACETDAVTRGGAYLRQFLDPRDELNGRLVQALRKGPWDFVILQEQSFNPVGDRADFLRSVDALCTAVRAIGATPALYATWAYREGSEKLAKTGCTYAAMDAGMQSAYAEAGARNGAPVIPAGRLFTRARAALDPLGPDDYHPAPRGTYLAACALALTLCPARPLPAIAPEGLPEAEAAALRALAMAERKE